MINKISTLVFLCWNVASALNCLDNWRFLFKRFNLSIQINQEKVRKYSLEVSGEADNVPVEFIVEVDLNSKMSGNADDYSPLHRLAAKLQLSEMLMQNSESKFFRSPESLRWPIAMGWRPSSCVVRRPLTSSSQELLSQS